MTWPQAFFYCFLALLAAPVVYVAIAVLGVWFIGWGDNGFWPFNRANKNFVRFEAGGCHDLRCPGASVAGHKCHDLDCKRHSHTKVVQ